MRLSPIPSMFIVLFALLVGCGEGEPSPEAVGQVDAGFSADASGELTSGTCLSGSDCGSDEVCVATDAGAAQGECALRCQEGRDVCPDSEQCVHVVDADGADDAACLTSAAVTTDAWQRCGDGDSLCGPQQRCVELGASLGAYCLPDCIDGQCEAAGASCALSWRQAEERYESCAHACETDDDCPVSLRCRELAGAGICLQ